VDDHVEHLVTQLASIIAAGVTSGDFTTAHPRAAARGVWDATLRFHHPVHAGEWADPEIKAQFRTVSALVVAGLGVAGDGRKPRSARS
jgi:hypothetical protein